MNDLERLEQAEESKLMTVMLLKETPVECSSCNFSVWEYDPNSDDSLFCLNGDIPVPKEGISDSCQIKKMVAYIGQDGNIKYCREEEDD